MAERTERTVPDMAAVLRIARRVNLSDVWLEEVHAKREPGKVSGSSSLQPEFSDQYEPVHVAPNVIELACHHDLKVSSDGQPVAEISLVYRMVYAVGGQEPISDSDIAHFAQANGAYHSWPFAREMFFSLTSRMGFPPYVLPVLTIAAARPVKAVAAEPSPVATEPKASE